MPAEKTLDTLRQELRKIVAEIGEISEEEIKDDANFIDDLGFDSMKALEVAAAIEKKYKIRISEEEIPKINSLVNVFKLLEKSLKN
ncbi:MAG: acyl carrier protein [Candidatus Omnitrophica bacterium]|nr:acyl carrier protein [Candidatus Omnitrophota bacterium]MBU4479512.1 acyl carrier protein [Candidatus Omnitrophota bacterium]MCG2702979.1 acyl carrier protein [Candidatus Omnitrophota bacterium]